MTASLTRFGWPAARLPSLFDDLFEGTAGWPAPFGNGSSGPFDFPPLAIWDAGQAVHLEAELPGVSLEELELTLDGSTLTLKGSRQDVREEQATWLRRERSVGEFTRSVRLPYEVEGDQVDARFENGVLTVVLPKAESQLPRKITVKENN